MNAAGMFIESEFELPGAVNNHNVAKGYKRPLSKLESVKQRYGWVRKLCTNIIAMVWLYRVRTLVAKTILA